MYGEYKYWFRKFKISKKEVFEKIVSVFNEVVDVVVFRD